MKDETRITVRIEAEFELPVDCVWPFEEDIPEKIDAEAVAKVFREETRRGLLDDWMFSDMLSFDVFVKSPNLDYTQSEILFGEEPPLFLNTSVLGVF